MIVNTHEEIMILRQGGRRLAYILETLKKEIKPGVSTAYLNDRAVQLIKKDGDTPTLFGYRPHSYNRPYPAVLCVSVNDEVANGVPHEHPRVLKEGDIVKLDMALTHDGLITDAAITVGVGILDKNAQTLLDTTYRALLMGIDKARFGNTLRAIGVAIEAVISSENLFVLKDFGGHGIGKELHELPFVPNHALPYADSQLVPGMVVAIEPIVIEREDEVYVTSDGYTVKTIGGSRGAHFEHTILITETEPEILTLYKA